VCIVVELSTPFEFITRISSFPKLFRVLGYVYKFLNLAKSRERSVSLTARELQLSFFKLMEIIQKNVFVEEYKKIKKVMFYNQVCRWWRPSYKSFLRLVEDFR